MKISRLSPAVATGAFALVLVMTPFARATIPLEYADIFPLYGDPVVPATYGVGGIYSGAPGSSNHSVKDYVDYMTQHPGPVVFNKNGLLVSVLNMDKDGRLDTIQYQRKDLFSGLEIEAILGGLSASEKWVSKGDNTWVLPTAGAYAKWDGNGKLVVRAQAPKPSI